jgi:hypothetical protein
MQTKSSYRVLKWTFIVGTMVSLGACVVTSGDGGDDDDDDFSDAGSSSTTAGKSGTTAGKSGAGGSATAGRGGSAGATTTPNAGSGGEGGAAYVPGLCEADLATPGNQPSCDLDAKDQDPDNACRTCLKTKCCSDWKTCFGDTPATACGSGPTAEADGQFECIRLCYLDDMSGDDAETVLGACEGKCLGQCEDEGFALTDTHALLGCGQENCLAECFTP